VESLSLKQLGVVVAVEEVEVEEVVVPVTLLRLQLVVESLKRAPQCRALHSG
jgi:hypothetical protein